MPEVTAKDFEKRNGMTFWVNGPDGSGKTRLALGFPGVMAVTADPTGLDILDDPANAALRENLKWKVPLNGLPLTTMFRFTEEAGEDSIYGSVALARQLAKQGKIQTYFLDGFGYLTQLKWTQICEAKGIDPTAKEATNKQTVDSRQMYDALGSYLDHLMLQNIFPLAVRDGLNVIVSCHVQRESKNTVEGIQDNRNPEIERQSKRLVNLDSDISPQVLGGFRQRIGGLPSAMIYLEHRLEAATDADVKAGRAKQEGAEILNYYAYCRQTRSASLDTVVKAKNRYGLGTLRLTDASFYKTLMRKINESKSAAQSKPESKTETPAAKAATNK